MRRAVVGYTRSLGVEHPSTKDASRHLAYVRTLRPTSDENVATISESDASSIDSYFEDSLMAPGPSSASSASAILQPAMLEEFVAGLAQLFRKDDGIRNTVSKALERSRDELKFDRPKIERNFSRLLRRYAEELNQNSSASVEKISAKFVRKKSHSISTAVFQTVRPAENSQNQTEILANQPVVKLMLDRFFEDPQTQDAGEFRIEESRSQNKQTIQQTNDDEENDSSDESEASHMDEFPPVYSIELVEAFLISGMPFTNLKQRFQDFIEHWPLNDMPHDDPVRDFQPRDFSSNLNYAEDGWVQVRWQCVSILPRLLQQVDYYISLLTRLVEMWPSVSRKYD